MKKLLVLAFLSPLAASATFLWAARASSASPYAPQAPRPRVAPVLADAGLRGGGHAGHQGSVAQQGPGTGARPHGGHGGHGGPHAHGGTERAPPGFGATLLPSTGDAVAGRPVTLAFTVRDARGNLVRELPDVHEKPMHLLVISKDLRDFFHLHPEPQADGSFRLEHTFPSGGDYTLFIDYTPKGAPQVVDRIPFTVKGAPRAKAALQADTTNTLTVDGLRVTMTPDRPPRPGEGVVLRFSVVEEKTGRPAADLEPYLGAMAHFVILSEDSKDFLHAHPLEQKPTGDGRVSAHTTFPRAGLYKAWVQLQRGGKVITVPFVMNVPGAPAVSAPAQGHEHAHH